MVQPTTMAGLIALLRYSIEFEIVEDCWPDTFVGDNDDSDDERPWHSWLQRHVADVLEAMSVRRVQW